MNPLAESGRVDKAVKIVGTSTESWEAAARNAVAEASKSIRDLTTATVMQSDLIVVGDEPTYRIKLQVTFRLDRQRSTSTGAAVEVTRYLVLANDTLGNPALLDFIADRAKDGGEFHMIVPQVAPSVLHADPATGLIGPAAHTMVAQSRQASKQEGERRLREFYESLGDLRPAVTGEVVLSDPVTAIRIVLARGSFDEIVISTMPAGISRWLKLDLPSRVERAFSLPVTTIHQEA